MLWFLAILALALLTLALAIWIPARVAGWITGRVVAFIIEEN